jgi:hypothetical protein
MRFLSLLVVLVIVGLSLSESRARTISEIPESTMVFGTERKTASSSQETGGIWEKLTAPRLKDRMDICVWKICSRPLKTTTTAKPELKKGEKAGGSRKIRIFEDKNGVYSLKVLKPTAWNNNGPYGELQLLLFG